jgi:3(or 17)beta-hydroxysteroid dehydrogenase
MGRVDGKVALITGGAGGIGAGTARLLAREGAIVTIADIAPSVQAVADEIGSHAVTLDVTSETQWERAVAEVETKHGGIDVLVNAAGIEGRQMPASVVKTTLEEWRRVHAVNLDGTFLGCRAVLRVMDTQRHGSIVNVGSMASFVGSPFDCAYGSSKAAVQQLTKAVAVWGSRGGKQIRCNSVHPGLVRTPMLRHIVGQLGQDGEDPDAMIDRMARRMLPLGAIGEPEDVAYQILYLASDESRHVTGSEFQIDGGWHLKLGPLPEPGPADRAALAAAHATATPGGDR